MVKLHSLQLTGDDPRIEAQPLYVPELTLSDGHKHNVVFICSMSNRVWAFDADNGNAVWATPAYLGPAFVPSPGDPVDKWGINKSFGILSTPVIDLHAGLIYVVYWLSDAATHKNRDFRISALRLTDGTAPHNRPALPIAATITNAAGQTISFNQVQKQRAALLLTPLVGAPSSHAHRMLYVAFTGSEDPPDDGNASKANHGWVMAFDVDVWKQAAAWISTPSSFGGGIWQGGQGPAADDLSNVYLMTGNGGYLDKPLIKDFTGTTDFPECFAKLSYNSGTSALALTDWFIPFRDLGRKKWSKTQVAPFPEGYDYTDQDLGSSGPILPPNLNLVLGAGKDGVLYVLNKSQFGKAVGDFTKLKQPPSFFTFEPNPAIAAYAHAHANGNLDFKPMLGVKTPHLHGSPAYWNSASHGPTLYVWGENNVLRAYSLDVDGKTKLLARGTDVASAKLADPTLASLGGMPGGMICVAANGTNDGIIWATAPVDDDANRAPVPGVVRAYDASAFVAGLPSAIPTMKKLWEQKGFTYSKFCPPVVADGRLFVPTYDGTVDVYVSPSQSAPPAPHP
ncbi:MAG: PQQ-binding-like beta-propeller repeat protein [Gemmataceae bacterium]